MNSQPLNISQESLIYRFNNGIKLYNPNQINKRKFPHLGLASPHSLASLLQFSFPIYFEDSDHTIISCNEITADACGFASMKDCIGSPWFVPYVKKSVIQHLYNDKEVVINKTLKIVEEKALR